MDDFSDRGIAVKKIGLRQSNAGNTVTFLLHHSDPANDLVTADLGTNFMMFLVEIDDNDQPAAHGKEPAPKSEPLTAPVAAVDLARAHAVKRAYWWDKP